MLRHVVYASLLNFGVEMAVIFASVFSAATRQQLSRPGFLARSSSSQIGSKIAYFGARFTRSWWFPAGFLWQGEIYSSLSTIALRITGVS